MMVIENFNFYENPGNLILLKLDSNFYIEFSI